MLDGKKTFVWSGSYKDKEDKTYFFKEFVSEGTTWNVYVNKKEDLKYGKKSINEILSIKI